MNLEVQRQAAAVSGASAGTQIASANLNELQGFREQGPVALAARAVIKYGELTVLEASHGIRWAGVLVEHGTVQPTGPGRPTRLYTSVELLGLTGSSRLRA